MARPGFAEYKYLPHLVTAAFIGIVFIGYRYFAYYDTRTNDAYVSANVVNMAAVVWGLVTEIYIKENQLVKKGEKLLQIDPRPFIYARNKAQADLHLAQLAYENNKLTIQIAEQKLKRSQLILSLKQQYLERYEKLQIQGDLPKLTLIDIRTKMHEQGADVLAALQALKIAKQNLENNNILAAKAALDEAVYQYENSTLRAPQDGYITNFNVRQGQYVNKGEGLFALVETAQWWIECRYRETAIRLIKPGDKAKITLDMYPGKKFHGHVISIGWGINRIQTGGIKESTLPYLEATEDWIQIAQRFPVRIVIDDVSADYPLRIGASAVTTTYR